MIPPLWDQRVNIEFIMGIGKVGQNVVLLLEIEQALTHEEMKS